MLALGSRPSALKSGRFNARFSDGLRNSPNGLPCLVMTSVSPGFIAAWSLEKLWKNSRELTCFDMLDIYPTTSLRQDCAHDTINPAHFGHFEDCGCFPRTVSFRFNVPTESRGDRSAR